MKRHRKSVAQKIIDESKIAVASAVAIPVAMFATFAIVGGLVYIYSCVA
jgi:hypothetical protein